MILQISLIQANLYPGYESGYIRCRRDSVCLSLPRVHLLSDPRELRISSQSRFVGR